MDNATMKGGALVGIKMVASEFATSHATNGVDKVAVVKVFEPILIQIVSVGATVEVHRWRILPTLLITGVL